jgi:DNA-binding response OmpR family regulator
MAPHRHVPPVEANVLLVEDSDGDASLVMAALAESSGRMETRWETSLAAARAALVDTSFECILVDLGLPDAEGLKVVDAVREAAPDTAIVVLTGRSDDALGLQAIKHGADDYLQKGDLSPRQLRRSIDYAIERTRSRLLMRRLSVQSEIVMQTLGDAIVVLDADGRVTAANPAAERLMRISPPDPSGVPQPPAVWPCLIHADGSAVLDHERPRRGWS